MINLCWHFVVKVNFELCSCVKTYFHISKHSDKCLGSYVHCQAETDLFQAVTMPIICLAWCRLDVRLAHIPCLNAALVRLGQAIVIVIVK